MKRTMHAPAQIPVLTVITLALVLAGSFFMGCATPSAVIGQNETRNGTDHGFRAVTVSGEQPAISFGEATVALAGLIPGEGNRSALNASPDNPILYARGTSLDANGNAASWIFVLRNNNRTYVVTAEQKGTNFSEWKGAFPYKEIRLESVISPADLFRKNGPEIFRYGKDNQTASRDLVLSMNNYTLTVKGRGETRVLVFDAATGILLRSNG